ncbi:hypothetical protein [Luteolibacter soli]|uniref:CopG family transcriptional regulator n=1 Tax=Luteolibacter soli TaxID=3135280 RepID=A0ABU9ASH3_9BACT
MKLTDEQEQKVLEMAAKDLADRVWAKVESSADEIALFNSNRAAGLLDLSTSQLSRVITEWVDFGARDRRFSIAQLRALIARRTARQGRR